MASDAAMSSTTNRRKLGRGLGSLISTPVQVPTAPLPPATADSAAMTHAASRDHAGSQIAAHVSNVANAGDAAGIRLLRISQIFPNPKQPRQVFDEAALKMLAGSISKSGLMQPIVVRPANNPKTAAGGFQIIAGERRWRAAQLAGLQQIPALVRDVDERTAAELSLVENLQREDLNPIERAEAFRRLVEDFRLTHQEIAEQVGIDRSSVTNHLRLNELDNACKQALRDGLLSMGHAKALLAIANLSQRTSLAAQALRQSWSVRELERRVKTSSSAGVPAAAAAESKALTAAAANVADLERRLAAHLGTKVKLHAGRSKGSGKLIIEFFTHDQFEGLLQRMQFDGN